MISITSIKNVLLFIYSNINVSSKRYSNNSIFYTDSKFGLSY